MWHARKTQTVENSTKSKHSPNRQKPAETGDGTLEVDLSERTERAKDTDFRRAALIAGEQSDTHMQQDVNGEDPVKSDGEGMPVSDVSVRAQKSGSVRTSDTKPENSNEESNRESDKDARTGHSMEGFDSGSSKEEEDLEGSEKGGAMTSREEISHQMLEILLYRAQLRLNVGHRKKAIEELEVHTYIFAVFLSFSVKKKLKRPPDDF